MSIYVAPEALHCDCSKFWTREKNKMLLLCFNVILAKMIFADGMIMIYLNLPV